MSQQFPFLHYNWTSSPPHPLQDQAHVPDLLRNRIFVGYILSSASVQTEKCFWPMFWCCVVAGEGSHSWKKPHLAWGGGRENYCQRKKSKRFWVVLSETLNAPFNKLLYIEKHSDLKVSVAIWSCEAKMTNLFNGCLQ